MQTPDHSISNMPSRISCDSQDQQWRKLETKYKDYIKLLKKKIIQLETKENTITKASLSINSCQPLQIKLEKIVAKRFRQSWNNILIQSIINVKDTNVENKTSINKDNFIKMGLKILQNLLHKRMKIYLENVEYTESKLSVQLKKIDNIMQARTLQQKTKAFLMLKSLGSSRYQRIQQLNYVKQILRNTELDSTFQSYDSNLYKLQKENCTLKTKINIVQVQIEQLKKQSHSYISVKEIELNQKQKIILQLLNQVSEKDKIIDQYQIELQTYRDLKGKSKCSPDCLVQKKKLGNYYEKSILQLKSKKQQIQQSENKYTQLLSQYNLIRKQQQQQIQTMRNTIDQLKKSLLQKSYNKSFEATRIGNLNKRQKLMDQKEQFYLGLQQQCNKLRNVFLNINKICSQQSIQKNSKVQEVLDLISKIPKDTIKQYQLQTNATTISPSGVINLIQKMLSQQYMKLQEFSIFSKGDQQRLFLIQTEISQIKKFISNKQRKIQQEEQQKIDDLLLIKTQINPEQRSNNLLNKVIDLQSQRKKDEEIIFELKKKILETRRVVFTCLDNLAIKNISKQGENKLEQLFDMFQYTDDEREIILLANNKSKQRFFKWI